jgi:hypothetical protein
MNRKPTVNHSKTGLNLVSHKYGIFNPHSSFVGPGIILSASASRALR